MPFDTEHTARQHDPEGYERFRRMHPDGFPDGVDAILGVKEGGGSEIQSLRFDSSLWTPERAKEWLKEHDFSMGAFEEAMHKTVQIVHASAPLRVLYAVVMEPETPDTYGDVIQPAEIQKAAHEFMRSRTLVVDHRIHPSDWPDGVDAIVASGPQGGVIVEEVRFDSSVWTEAKAREWMETNGFDHGRLDDGPITPDLVESFLAPNEITEMHGEQLSRPVKAGSWVIGAKLTQEEWEHRMEFTGVSFGGTASRDE